MTYYNNNFFSKQSAGSKSSAEVIVPILMTMFKPNSVVDVGCGIGTWLKEFENCGVNTIAGVDSHVEEDMLLISKDKFIRCDFNNVNGKDCNPGAGKWDLAISLETAEHVNPERSECFVRLLASLSNIVVFSAAIPYQGGRHHVNEKWQEEWRYLFQKVGYKAYDILRQDLLWNYNVEWWYSQNIIVYANDKANLQYDKAKYSLNLVHPKKYMSMATNSYVTFSQWVEMTKALLAQVTLTTEQKRKRIYGK